MKRESLLKKIYIYRFLEKERGFATPRRKGGRQSEMLGGAGLSADWTKKGSSGETSLVKSVRTHDTKRGCCKFGRRRR